MEMPEEKAAIDSVLRTRFPDRPLDSFSEDEMNAVRAEMRDRQSEGEERALEMLRKAMHNAPSRTGANSKFYALFVFFVFTPLIVIFILWELYRYLMGMW